MIKGLFLCRFAVESSLGMLSLLNSTIAWVTLLREVAPGLFAACFYGFVSGSMSFGNKIVLTSYNYHFPDMLMLMQITVTAVVLEVCRVLKLSDIPAWTQQRSREFIIPSLCFAAHTTLALAALDDLSIPIYNMLRRMLPLANLVAAYFVLKQPPSNQIALSVVVAVAGCIFAGVGDLQFNFAAYGLALSSVVAQSIYLTYVQKTGLEKGVSALSVLHLNSINCIPFMLVCTVISGSFKGSLLFEGLSDRSFVYAFGINILLGCVLNYSLFLCATTNSALTTSLVGLIKGVVTTIIGFFTFGGVPVTFLTVGGVALNTLGGSMYTYLKFAEKKATYRRTSFRSSYGVDSSCVPKNDFGSPFHRKSSLLKDSCVVDVDDELSDSSTELGSPT